MAFIKKIKQKELYEQTQDQMYDRAGSNFIRIILHVIIQEIKMQQLLGQLRSKSFLVICVIMFRLFVSLKCFYFKIIYNPIKGLG